jgi:hypothetical protein
MGVYIGSAAFLGGHGLAPFSFPIKSIHAACHLENFILIRS